MIINLIEKRIYELLEIIKLAPLGWASKRETEDLLELNKRILINLKRRS